jgi:hypothetical protein
MQKDGEAQQLLQDHQKQIEHIRQLEAEVKPVEVDDKRKLAELEQKIASNDLIKSFMKAQVDYADLMQRVRTAMEPSGVEGRSGGKA